MIYLYHKVDYTVPTYRWVSADAFNRQMAALQSKKVIYLDDYDRNNPEHVVITFDGGYENIATVAAPILKRWGYPFEVFVIGKYIGGDNTFDSAAEPFCRFATMEQLRHIAESGGRIQWHTMTHRILQNIAPEAIREEVLVPGDLRGHFPGPHFGWFAYPHGRSDQLAVDLVRSHFRGALATGKGEATDSYQMFRMTVREGTSLFPSPTCALVWANGDIKELVQTLDSLKRQSIPPDHIFVLGPAMSTTEDLAGRAWGAQMYNGPALGIENAEDLFAEVLAHMPQDAVLVVARAGAHLSPDYLEVQRAKLDASKSDCVVCRNVVEGTHPQSAARDMTFGNFTTHWEKSGLDMPEPIAPVGTHEFFKKMSSGELQKNCTIICNDIPLIYIDTIHIQSVGKALDLALLEFYNKIYILENKNKKLDDENKKLARYKKKNEQNKKINMKKNILFDFIKKYFQRHKNKNKL